ncbi:MAG: hypothetical protein IPF53_20620 [Blastocatellia bacterium]|nr:hypothetical protein [Blastocatellia bacterium]
MWKVFPHPEKGFPGPIDDDVMMALLELTREQGGFEEGFFSRYDLLKRLGWPINATYYTRLETSFRNSRPFGSRPSMRSAIAPESASSTWD